MSKNFLIIVVIALITVINADDSKKNPKIIIVGAGLSGLSAAVRLIEHGYDDILILEAENRIGGRIHSVEFSDGFVDLGGQWVHGQKNNSVYEMVEGKYEFGETGFDNYYPTFLQSDGIILDQDVCQKLGESAVKILFSSFDEMSKFPGSVEEFFKKAFKKEASKVKADYALIHEMIDFYEKEMNIWNGSMSWKELSAPLHSISGHNAGVQHLTWKRDGFQKFIDFLIDHMNLQLFSACAQAVPVTDLPEIHHKSTCDQTNLLLDLPNLRRHGHLVHDPAPQKFFTNGVEYLQDDQEVLDKIILNKEVVNIQWTKNYDNKLPIVTTADGYKYSSDHIIFTASLGVLKERHRTLFSPQLPVTLRRAIEFMGYGNIGKVFLEFDESFWPINKEWVAYGLLWTKEDKKKLKGTKQEWLLDVQAFAKLDAFPNVLEALLAGPHMKVFETISDEQIIDDSMWVLEKFLQKSLPRPKSMRRTKWLTQPNFLGSYSYNSVNAWKFKISSKDLQETLYNLKKKPEILFAGEHTDDLYSSNAHGAVNSGYRAADKLINYYT